MIEAVVIAIPVHDEERLLPACLAAVTAAIRHLAATHPDVATEVRVGLDGCSDRSEEITHAWGFGAVVVSERKVGAARAAALRAGREVLGGVMPSRLWTAHTDADSAVPPQWLSHQLDLADAGADVVLGTVRPDFRDLDADRIRAWWARYTPGAAADDVVHGANLGIRASALDAAGGVPPLAEHEDVRLVDAARASGAVVVSTDGARVRTSGRTVGRTPGGYARYLREDLVDPEGIHPGAPSSRVTVPATQRPDEDRFSGGRRRR